MIKSNRTVLFALGIWLVAANSARADCLEDGVATQYLRAIEQQDMQGMSTLLSDQAHYLDPTMTEFDGPAVDLNAKADIIDFWQASFEQSGSGKLQYRIDGCFVAGDTTVMTLHLDIEVSGAFWGVNTDMIDLNGRHIMTLRIAEDKITSHTDYVDYQALLQQVEQLKQVHGEAST
jgi:ketosteroid isomerase-like protein